ncbi:hypothetical protein D8674_005820 [Pyrus ussuriensis x Pyrus communis]|uniref:Uncharacterized protein n=1 Tax=Pyrus ussuriensis x Pyrus communis TaxID=2448454 RepID=A0A5N5FSU6_9ROSA|nr:hypothetical protein D8674_005820 [Pyrus ussuriensis x Pyrus communis]
MTKLEVSIVEAWVAYESLALCTMYLQDVEMALNHPQCNNDGGVKKRNILFLPKLHNHC